MRYVYLLERRQLNDYTNRYEFYDTEAYGSLKKLEAGLDNSMECNKAFNIEFDDYKWSNVLRTVTYSTMGHLSETEQKEMRLRMVLKKIELR